MTADFLYSIVPYVAVAVLVLGVPGRWFMAFRKPGAAAEESREAMHLLVGGKLWQLSLAVLVVVHVAILTAPRVILNWNSSLTRLYGLEGIAFLAGLGALAGWLLTLRRNIDTSSRPAATEIADTAFLALLLTGIVTGLLMAATSRWSSTWGAMTLTPYVKSLLRGSPEPSLVTGLPFVARLHVFSAFVAMIVLPGTRLVALLVLMLQGVLAVVGRPLAAVSQLTENWITKHNPAGRIWPEED